VGLLAYPGLLEVNGMKRFFLVVCALALVASAAYADVPDPSNCETTLDGVQRLYLCPDGLGDCTASDFCVTVRNAANAPINNAVVEILVGGQPTYTLICPGQTTVANTDVAGVVCFNIAGGGCYKHQADAGIIRANGINIREFEAVMSSDYVGQGDDGEPSRYDHLVAPDDLSSFVSAYQGGAGPASCHDYDNNGVTDPGDLAVFIAAYKGGANRCP
jgi:hypothetical protein